MYVGLDVFNWLHSRRWCGRPDLQRVGNYVLATSSDRREFEKFRDSEFYKDRPLMNTDLLVEFMKMRKLPVKLIWKYGMEYVTNFPSSHFDDLCEWSRKVLNEKLECEQPGMYVATFLSTK